ncbi:zinc finger protein ZAT5-like [Lolium rigidum]|uniref:zinc finger protein ZAT5-like n=1 Tax=Lolium rigidum TaxID=89674 RepID=UPI001F5DA3A5|nr:zinc finger protein ZAT5-like [Lolium rigidum]
MTSKPSMGLGMKRAREEQPVSLALSLTTDSTPSCTTSADSAGAAPMAARKRARRGRVVATSGEGEFVCKTCGRAFATFQALGGHRTSHLRGRHGLELGVGVAKAIKNKKPSEDKQSHECNICGLGFETGPALGGHMRRHREEMALSIGAGGADHQWLIARPDQKEVVGHGAHRPPVLLELFV